MTTIFVRGHVVTRERAPRYSLPILTPSHLIATPMGWAVILPTAVVRQGDATVTVTAHGWRYAWTMPRALSPVGAVTRLDPMAATTIRLIAKRLSRWQATEPPQRPQGPRSATPVTVRTAETARLT